MKTEVWLHVGVALGRHVCLISASPGAASTSFIQRELPTTDAAFIIPHNMHQPSFAPETYHEIHYTTTDAACIISHQHALTYLKCSYLM